MGTSLPGNGKEDDDADIWQKEKNVASIVFSINNNLNCRKNEEILCIIIVLPRDDSIYGRKHKSGE
jgi:hypothetical protein